MTAFCIFPNSTIRLSNLDFFHQRLSGKSLKTVLPLHTSTFLLTPTLHKT